MPLQTPEVSWITAIVGGDTNGPSGGVGVGSLPRYAHGVIWNVNACPVATSSSLRSTDPHSPRDDRQPCDGPASNTCCWAHGTERARAVIRYRRGDHDGRRASGIAGYPVPLGRVTSLCACRREHAAQIRAVLHAADRAPNVATECRHTMRHSRAISALGGAAPATVRTPHYIWPLMAGLPST